jgi:hypothetical protein
MVSGAAAAALGADGRFRFPLPVLRADQVSLATAREQALQFAKYATNNVLLRGAIENGRGGYWTDPHLLTLCRDAYLVRSQLQSFHVDSLPASGQALLQRRVGAQWLIPFCGSKGEPQMTIQIAVEGNDIRFEKNAPVEPYQNLTAAYFGRGVPLNWPDVLPISAERAVRFAYDQLGVRIAEVPELYFRGNRDVDGVYREFQTGAARYCNRWRIVFDRDVSLQGTVTRGPRTTREVFVGAYSCQNEDVTPLLQLPLEIQPADGTLQFFDDSVVPLKTYAIRVPIASPVHFELAQRAASP